MYTVIAGSRKISQAGIEYVKRVVQRCHQLDHTIIVGDNPLGIDMAVVLECNRLKYDCIVIGISKQSRNTKQETGWYEDRTEFNNYAERDQHMISRAELGMFIWNGTSNGTIAGYNYMVRLNKEAHLKVFK